MTTAERITARLKEGDATAKELGLTDVSSATLERKVSMLVKLGQLRIVGTRNTGKRGTRPFVYAVSR